MVTMTTEKNLNAPWRPNVTSITLGGFQVFDEIVTIPLRRLTFLFGPNSAGKSAVEDALVLLHEALTPGPLDGGSGPSYDSAALYDNLHDHPTRFSLYEPQRFERLKRDWRKLRGREGLLPHEESLAPTLTLGVGARLHRGDWNKLKGKFGSKRIKNSPPADSHEVNITLTYRQMDMDDWPRIQRDFSIVVDENEIARLEEFERFGLNLAHPMLSSMGWNADFLALSRTLPDVVVLEGGWLWLKSLGTRITASRMIDRDVFLERTAKSKKPIGASAKIQLREALEEVARAFDSIESIVRKGIRLFRPKVVHASRTVPNRAELTQLCTSHLDEYQPNCFDKNDVLKEFGLYSDFSNQYMPLADSIVHAKLGLAKDDQTLTSLFYGVNHALTDHLFAERGYRLDADCRILLDIQQFTDINSSDRSDAGQFPILVRIFLVDSQGRQFSFDEVGSGLGYVLPILCSVFDPDAYGALLQQPELHLHPALQTALGDVFIEASSNGISQFVIETHSEHLLLRVLKRIRQTARSNGLATELRIGPGDVSIVYFEPSPEGKTTIKHLRISDDGDFLDRWPRGFFVEREGELFDE